MWRFLKRAFTRDIPLKLGSVALALLIMILILAVRMESRTISGVPVRFTNIPPNMKPPQWDRKSVDVTMRGPREVLDEVTGKVAVDISLKGMQAGSHEITLEPKYVDIAIPEQHRRRIQIDDSIEDWVVNLDLDQYEAWVPIATPVITGTPLSPWYTDASMIELNPPGILVTAPPRVLQQIEETGRSLTLEFGTIDIQGADQATYIREKRVDFDALGVKPVNHEEETVSVVINFEKTGFRKELVVENVQVRNKPEDADVNYQTDKIHVTVEGRKSVIDSLDPDELTAWVDATAAVGAGDFVSVNIEVTAPEDLGVTIIDWQPTTMKLKVIPSDKQNERKQPPAEDGPSG
jgi:hypothetical protein